MRLSFANYHLNERNWKNPHSSASSLRGTTGKHTRFTLYVLYTYDLSMTGEITINSFADDPAIFSINVDPLESPSNLPEHLNFIDSRNFHPLNRKLSASSYQPFI